MLNLVSNNGLLIKQYEVLDEPCVMQVEEGPNSLTDFFSIFDIKNRLLPDEYANVAKLVNVPENEFLRLMPIERLKAEIEALDLALGKVLECKANIKYLDKFIKMRLFLDSMHDPVVDLGALHQLIKSQVHDGVKSNLRTFENPGRVQYSMSNSTTGRLSVTHGAKILTAPGEVKSVLRSRFPEGRVLQIDLSCAEPNFALFFNRDQPMPNLYEFCADQVLEGKVDRSTAKLIMLSAIYGQSTKNLSHNLPSGLRASEVIKKVKNFLKIESLQEKLRKDWSAGEFRNYLGRPLNTSQQRLLISHFLQSSVAELAIIMFKDFCANHSVSPIFVIHDALIVDCDSKTAKDFLNNEEFCFNFEGFKFPATITQLG